MRYYRKPRKVMATLPVKRDDCFHHIPVLFCQSFYDRRMFLTRCEVIKCGGPSNPQSGKGEACIRVPGVFDSGIWHGVTIGRTACITQMAGKFPINYPGVWVDFDPKNHNCLSDALKALENLPVS